MSIFVLVLFGVIRFIYFSNLLGSLWVGVGLRIILVLVVLVFCVVFKMLLSGVFSCISK